MEQRKRGGEGGPELGVEDEEEEGGRKERNDKKLEENCNPAHLNPDINHNLSMEKVSPCAHGYLDEGEGSNMKQSLAFAVLFMVVPFLPASNIFFQVIEGINQSINICKSIKHSI